MLIIISLSNVDMRRWAAAWHRTSVGAPVAGTRPSSIRPLRSGVNSGNHTPPLCLLQTGLASKSSLKKETAVSTELHGTGGRDTWLTLEVGNSNIAVEIEG